MKQLLTFGCLADDAKGILALIKAMKFRPRYIAGQDGNTRHSPNVGRLLTGIDSCDYVSNEAVTVSKNDIVNSGRVFCHEDSLAPIACGNEMAPVPPCRDGRDRAGRRCDGDGRSGNPAALLPALRRGIRLPAPG